MMLDAGRQLSWGSILGDSVLLHVGLSMQLLGLAGQQLGSNKEHYKREETEAASYLKAWLQKFQSVTSAIFYWS